MVSRLAASVAQHSEEVLTFSQLSVDGGTFVSIFQVTRSVDDHTHQSVILKLYK